MKLKIWILGVQSWLERSASQAPLGTYLLESRWSGIFLSSLWSAEKAVSLLPGYRVSGAADGAPVVLMVMMVAMATHVVQEPRLCSLQSQRSLAPIPEV